MAEGVASYAGVKTAMTMAKRSFTAAEAAAHSAVSLETRGVTEHEIDEVQHKAAELSRKFRAFSRTSIEHMIGDARSYTGSLEHGMDVMPDVLRLGTIQKAMHGHVSDEELGAVIKATEIGGVAADPKKLHERLETFAKIMNVFGDTIKPSDFRSFYAQAGIAARTLSDKFMKGTGAHLMQELGGGQTGNAIDMFQAAIQGGRMEPKAMEQFDKLGLLDEDKVRRKKNGEIRWIDPGGIKNFKQAMSDPDEWLWNTFKPALEAHVKPEDRDNVLQALFGNKSERKFADKVLNQRAVIEKDAAMVEKAEGLKAAETWMEKDPKLAGQALEQQLENTFRMAGKPFAGGAIRRALTGFVSWFNEGAEGHEWAATSAMVGAGSGVVAVGLKAGQMAARGVGKAIGEGMAKAGGAEAVAAGASEGIMTRIGRVVGSPKAFAERFAKSAGIETSEVGAALTRAGMGLVSTAARGAVLGAATAAGEYGIHKGFDYLNRNKSDAQKAWIESQRNRSTWDTIVDTGGAFSDWWHGRKAGTSEKARYNLPSLDGGAGAAAQPQVETGAIDQAKEKAASAGQDMKAALDVTAAPQVDTSSIDAALAKVRELGAALAAIGAQARAAAASIPRGTGALHDGFETR